MRSFALLVLMMLPLLGLAQNGRLAGTVFFDSTSSINNLTVPKPGWSLLPGVLVQVIQNGKVVAEATSGKKGEYTVYGLAPGMYDARYILEGYQPKLILNIEIYFESTTHLRVNLRKSSPELESQNVEDYQKLNGISKDFDEPEPSKSSCRSRTVLVKVRKHAPSVHYLMNSVPGVYASDFSNDFFLRSSEPPVRVTRTELKQP